MGSDGDYHHSPTPHPLASWSQQQGRRDEPSCAPVPDGCRPLGTTARPPGPPASPPPRALRCRRPRPSSPGNQPHRRTGAPLRRSLWNDPHSRGPFPFLSAIADAPPERPSVSSGLGLSLFGASSLPFNLTRAPAHQHLDTHSSVPTARGGKQNTNTAGPFSSPDQANWLKTLSTLTPHVSFQLLPPGCVQAASAHRLPRGWIMGDAPVLSPAWCASSTGPSSTHPALSGSVAETMLDLREADTVRHLPPECGLPPERGSPRLWGAGGRVSEGFWECRPPAQGSAPTAAAPVRVELGGSPGTVWPSRQHWTASAPNQAPGTR